MRLHTRQLLLACVALRAACPSTLNGQSQESDPNLFMRTAAASCSMIAPGMKPWHLRAKYQQFAKDGSIEHEGVFEMWWASAERYKTSFYAGGSERIEYHAGKDTFFTGEDDSPPQQLRNSIPYLLLHPLPSEAVIENSVFKSKNVALGGADMRCYFELPKLQSGTLPHNVEMAWQPHQVYCFQGALPALRVSETFAGSGNTVSSYRSFNSIVRFQDHYLARSIRASSEGHPWLNIDVDIVDSTLGIDDAALDPPPDAKAARVRPISVSSAVIAGSLISAESPVYPPEARRASIQGTVVLTAIIGKDGKIADLKAVSGPNELQDAALRAVRKWKYKPYLLNGEPVEVRTEVDVVFRF